MDNTYIEIIDENGNSISRPRSAIEQMTSVTSYNDLVYKIHTISKEDDEVGFGDGKTYYPHISTMIWKTVILATKPMVANAGAERELLESIYTLLFSFAKSGEYPLLQMLCNYLGIGLDDFFATLGTTGHPNRKVYLWSYNVFEAASSMNAIRSNGNANIRVWLDKSREHKISAESKLELTIEARKMKQIEDRGRDIEMSLLEE